MPAGTPDDRNLMYATMACISGLSNGSARPFMLRDMHEFTRSSIVISAPRRALYFGNSSTSTKIGRPNFFVPTYRLKFLQARLLPAKRLAESGTSGPIWA